jgi:flagellum-specific peptidoglycan hydrolase FlgJ
MKPNDFIAMFRPMVIPIAQKYNVPASVLLAQIAVESGWLTSHFSTQYKNLTGMKADGSPIPGIWDGAKSVQPTTEEFTPGKVDHLPLPFRVYKNYQQSIEDLAHRHAVRFKINLAKVGGDINKFIDKVVSSGYATGSNYYNLLNQEIDQFKLYELDKGSTFTKKVKAAPPTNPAPSPGAKKK